MPDRSFNNDFYETVGLISKDSKWSGASLDRKNTAALRRIAFLLAINAYSDLNINILYVWKILFKRSNLKILMKVNS